MIGLLVLSIILTMGITDTIRGPEPESNRIKHEVAALGLERYVRTKGIEKEWPRYMSIKVSCKIVKNDYGVLRATPSFRLISNSRIIPNSLNIHGKAVFETKILERVVNYCDEKALTHKINNKKKEVFL